MYTTLSRNYLYRITFTLLVLFSVNNTFSRSFTSFPFYEGPFEELQKSAVFNNKPVVIYFYENECQLCKDMERNTWNDLELINYAKFNVLASRKNLYTYEGNLLAGQYNIEQPGTILIFSPTGELLERITQLISPQDLLRRLEKIYLQYQPNTSIEPQQTVNHLTTRSEIKNFNKTNKYFEVPEYFYRSPEAYSNLKHREAYTVIYQRVTKVRKIKRKIRKIRKRWPNRIWIMREEKPTGEESYVIGLGKFNSNEDAEYYSMLFESWNKEPKETLKLNGIFEQ